MYKVETFPAMTSPTPDEIRQGKAVPDAWIRELQTSPAVTAGGMESMSNAPFYLSRSGPSYGGARLMVGTELCQVARSCIIIISFDNYRKMYCVKLMSACPSGIMVNIKIHTT